VGEAVGQEILLLCLLKQVSIPESEWFWVRHLLDSGVMATERMAAITPWP
jgi:hypothetical protein